jgi:hypothetical protein
LHELGSINAIDKKGRKKTMPKDNRDLYPKFQLRSPSAENAGAKMKKKREDCSLHDLVRTHAFDIDEAKSFLRNREGLLLCDSCTLFFRRMVNNANAEAQS